MNLQLTGKRVLITGASRGLGKAVAKLLAQEGAKVCSIARTADELENLLTKLGGTTQGHCIVPLDLMAKQAAPKLYQIVQEKFGPVEIIIHNLGGTLGVKDALSSFEDFQKVWYFNLGVAIEINRLFIPAMQQSSWGRIVHVSSSSAIMADASLAYSSAKAAVNTYVKGLGREMAQYGIIVNAVMPGPFVADGGHWDFVAKNDPEKYQRFATERMAVHRLGNPDEIGNIIAMLCSEHASFMPGAVVAVDGGIR